MLKDQCLVVSTTSIWKCLNIWSMHPKCWRSLPKGSASTWNWNCLHGSRLPLKNKVSSYSATYKGPRLLSDFLRTFKPVVWKPQEDGTTAAGNRLYDILSHLPHFPPSHRHYLPSVALPLAPINCITEHSTQSPSENIKHSGTLIPMLPRNRQDTGY
jgi:hypothetical protein